MDKPKGLRGFCQRVKTFPWDVSLREGSVNPLRPLLVLLFVALTTGAAGQGLDCRNPAQAMMVGELLFGRNIGGRLGVTESQWRQFLAGEVTPRFPDGLTVFDAAGQWRDQKTNRVVRERSKVVMIIMPAEPSAQ